MKRRSAPGLTQANAEVRGQRNIGYDAPLRAKRNEAIMIRLRRVFGVTTFAIAGFMFGCFAEDGGECSAGAPCPRRGEACDDTTKTCELQDLDVEGTGAN